LNPRPSDPEAVAMTIHFCFFCRAKKLDWEKIRFDELSAEDCQKYWYYIQERIRRFRILSELIPGSGFDDSQFEATSEPILDGRNSRIKF
jgi:hypothetical protein